MIVNAEMLDAVFFFLVVLGCFNHCLSSPTFHIFGMGYNQQPVENAMVIDVEQ